MMNLYRIRFVLDTGMAEGKTEKTLYVFAHDLDTAKFFAMRSVNYQKFINSYFIDLVDIHEGTIFE